MSYIPSLEALLGIMLGYVTETSTNTKLVTKTLKKYALSISIAKKPQERKNPDFTQDFPLF